MSLLFVGAKQKVGGGRENPLYSGKSFGDKGSDLSKVFAGNKNQKIVSTRHKITGFHFLKTSNSHGKAIKTAFTLGTDLHFDHCPNSPVLHFLRIEDGKPTKKALILLEATQLCLDLGFFFAEDICKMIGTRFSAFEQEGKNITHSILIIDKSSARVKGEKRLNLPVFAIGEKGNVFKQWVDPFPKID
jgi:hypothetical protein